MSRATEAFEDLDAAITLLGLCGSFCNEPETFEVFRAWAHKEIDRPGMAELTTAEERAEGHDSINQLTPETLLHAAVVASTFADGIKASRAAEHIPDILMHLAGQAMGGPHGG